MCTCTARIFQRENKIIKGWTRTSVHFGFSLRNVMFNKFLICEWN